MTRNIFKAEKTIAEMSTDFWMDVRTLAKNAQLGVQTMSRFLIIARKWGLVEHKCVTFHGGRLHLWKRMN